MLNINAQKTVRPASGRIALIALVALGASASILSVNTAFAQGAEFAVQAPDADGQPPQGQPPQGAPQQVTPQQVTPPGMQQPGAPEGPQASAPQQNEVQEILARFGQFMKHEKYGDVWKPTQVQQGWRPYEPCHWTFNREMNAWFFDDKTEWGAIVHHYGRWTLDAQQGWLWVPGQEFSPGWVSWSQRPGEVGWAALPPEQDGNVVHTASFQNDPNLWIWVPAGSLGQGCNAPMPQPRAMAPFAPPMGISSGVIAGGVVGGYIGGYRPPRIIIVNHCWRNPRWCGWRPPHHRPNGRPHFPRPNRPHLPRPGDQAGKPKPGGIQCVRAPCKLPGQIASHPGIRPLPRPIGRPLIRPNFRPHIAKPNFRPHVRPNIRPHFNQRPHVSRNFARPNRSFAPRQQFRSAPRMSAPRMAQRSFNGGNRGGRGGFRR